MYASRLVMYALRLVVYALRMVAYALRGVVYACAGLCILFRVFIPSFTLIVTKNNVILGHSSGRSSLGQTTRNPKPPETECKTDIGKAEMDKAQS